MKTSDGWMWSKKQYMLEIIHLLICQSELLTILCSFLWFTSFSRWRRCIEKRAILSDLNRWVQHLKGIEESMIINLRWQVDQNRERHLYLGYEVSMAQQPMACMAHAMVLILEPPCAKIKIIYINDKIVYGTLIRNLNLCSITLLL